MARISFIFDNKYYEYDCNQIDPIQFEEVIPKEIQALYNMRYECIKDIHAIASVIEDTSDEKGIEILLMRGREKLIELD